MSEYTKCAYCGYGINPVSHWKEIIDGKTVKFCTKGCAMEYLRKQENK